MSRGPTLLMMTGAALLATGSLIKLRETHAPVSPALVSDCQAKMAKRGADAATKARCVDETFAIAMTVKDATEAARSISSSNNRDALSSSAGMLLIGVGFALIIGAFFMRRLGTADPF